MATSNRGVGRPSKGERRLIGFRLALQEADLVREIADAEGYEHVSDWVADVVSERIDRTDMSKIGHQVEASSTLLPGAVRAELTGGEPLQSIACRGMILP